MLIIDNTTYTVTENTILVPYLSPLQLYCLKPKYRKVGNTIGKIPLHFISEEHIYKIVYPSPELKLVGAKPHKIHLANNVWTPEWCLPYLPGKHNVQTK